MSVIMAPLGLLMVAVTTLVGWRYASMVYGEQSVVINGIV